MRTGAINGLGRIGRSALKVLLDVDGLEFVAVNDNLPWEELGVDLVLECTGVFTAADDLERHTTTNGASPTR